MSFPLPEFIQLYPTTRCNQHCYFCFNNPSLARVDNAFDLPYERALTLLDILGANSVKEIDIMGGEPLILPWMPDFIEIALEKRMTVNISTNGSNAEAFSRLKNVDPRKCTIGISLEGSKSESHNVITNSSHFDVAVKSIESLVSFGLDPVVKTVITRSNLHDLQNIIDLVKGIGVRRYYLIHMDLMSGNTSLMKDAMDFINFERCYQFFRRANPDMGIFKVHASCFHRNLLPDGVRCAGGVRKISISPDGSVFPCNLFHGFGEFNLGNIFESDLSSLWNGPKLTPFREYRGNRCENGHCANRALCTGGCPAHGYYHHGDTEHMDIRCTLPLGTLS